MTTTELSPGIYRIAVAGRHDNVEPALLTRHGEGGHVTILPPSAQPDPKQEWGVMHGKEPGNIIIGLPTRLWPSSYLTYNGAPEKPKQGNRVEYRVFEFHETEWHLDAIVPGYRYFLHVAGSHLGIRLSPATIHPPILQLGIEHQLEWRFERVRDAEV
ncbi:hypothetical protein F5887DRAFT_1070913 [Amanita rubescens]|nr:hypothetical protein F5887DRAFT_1070913 [Amanita rubescens]